MAKLRRPLLKQEILAAQKDAKSAAHCARILNVSFQTYKKYAKMYGVFENVLNPEGIGISKGFSYSSRNTTKLRDILDNKHPGYSMKRLKYRLIARGLKKDKCESCGFEETRVTDKKSPLVLTFKEEHGDYQIENLEILCYNCIFLLKGGDVASTPRGLSTKIGKTIAEKAEEKYGDKFIPTPTNSEQAPEPLEEFGMSEDELKSLREELFRDLNSDT